MNSPYEKFGPIIASGLAVLVIGLWNPRPLQAKKGGRYSGTPNIIWLALISVLVGITFQWLNPIESLCKRL